MWYWHKSEENEPGENVWWQNKQNLDPYFVQNVENAFIFTFYK